MIFFEKYKKLILSITFSTLICVIASLIMFFYFNNSSIEASSSNTISKNNIASNIENNKNEATNNVLITILNDIPKKEDIPEIVTDEKASNKELKEEKVNKTEVKKSTSPYYIKVNYKANVVTIYTKDKNDKYTVPYKAMVCSCGTYTPKSGTYKTSDKYKWGKLIHDVYGQYVTRIVGSILFHSVPYSSNTNDSLLYKQYDKLGTSASAGCVRLTVKDAKWIYDNCPRNTMVEFYSNSDPGPLGKPTAQKISSVEECRNWDPTDPVVENPWHTYTPEVENKEPTVDVPSTDVPNTDVPEVDNNSTNTPSTDVPVTDNNSTDTPSSDVPVTDNNTTDTPSSDVPEPDNSTTDTPNTDVPEADNNTTDTPSSDVPEPDNNTTDTPSSDVPVTNNNATI